MDIYVVKYGDSIERIANELGVDAETLIYDNQLVYPYELAVGQALLVNRYTRNASGSISTGGYAYPFINSWVLEQTLPFLSELYVFSYGFTAQGELLPPAYGEDDWMIAEALRFGTRPVLTLTPFDENGNFNNQLIHSVVNNPDYGKHLISNLLQTMYGKGYQGVDIDFEYILADGMHSRRLCGRWQRTCGRMASIPRWHWRPRPHQTSRDFYMKGRTIVRWERRQIMSC